MNRLSIFHFYPKRVLWIGFAVLGLLLMAASPFALLLFGHDAPFFVRKGRVKVDRSIAPYSFSLGLNEAGPALPVPDLQGEMTFSFDPPRPDTVVSGKRLLVRLKKSSESKRVVLPCRLDLEFQRDKLTFAKEGSPFWLDLSLTPGGQIEAKAFISSAEQEKMEAGHFVAMGQECPIQLPYEFPEGSAFRLLAEAKWWGKDQFREGDTGERLEVGPEILELKEGDWLVWHGTKWEKAEGSEKDAPIAHIQSGIGKALVLEGWNAEGHVRISLAPAAGAPFKVKGEELFSAIRIRSEKQISCMLEKQCMVLKTGDWVLKSGGRWKVLRKEQEREAVLDGKVMGDLFVFEQIAQRQGQKVIQGRLFNPGRTQMVAIEMAAQSMRKGREKGKKLP